MPQLAPVINSGISQRTVEEERTPVAGQEASEDRHHFES